MFARLTLFSVSEPNSARLLSFQSYFLALRKPAMTLILAGNVAGGELLAESHTTLLYADLGNKGSAVTSAKECDQLYTRESEHAQ